MRPGSRLWTHFVTRLAAPLFAAPLALLGGCSSPGYPPPAAKTPSQITDFTTLYAQNCAACHGRDGQNGPALDLANPEYLALADDTVLRKATADGVTGTEMPAFAESSGGMLTNAQIDDLVAGMRRRWSKPNAFAGSAPPLYAQTKPGDWRSGEQTYKARCAGCHRDSPDEQLTSPVYLSLVSEQGLRTIIIAGRPDIGQPDWRHDSPDGKLTTPLTAADVDNIVAYLGSLRNPAPLAQAPAQAIDQPAVAKKRSKTLSASPAAGGSK